MDSSVKDEITKILVDGSSQKDETHKDNSLSSQKEFNQEG